MNYYNEFDPKAAAWLRELMKNGLIPKGEVDERSIADVQPGELDGFRQCHFFAGIGGWSHALQLAQWPEEREVWTGSCPCQPFSAAGKLDGASDERHLWPHFLRLITERHPQCVFGEQVTGAIGFHWLDGICTDLEKENYAIGSVVLGAHSVGAPHIRQRLYWMADAIGARTNRYAQAGFSIESIDRPSSFIRQEWEGSAWSNFGTWNFPDGRRRCEPGSLPLVDGVSEGLDEMRGYGNAIVPQVAAAFIGAYLDLNSDKIPRK